MNGEKIINGKNYLFIFLRIFLSLIIVFALLKGRKDIAFSLFILTVAIAFLDGIIARRNRDVSQFRSLLDPFADKLLINSLALIFFFREIFPYWLIVVYLLKDIILVGGAVTVILKNAKTVFRSNIIDKICAFIQYLVLFLAFNGKRDYVLFWISTAFVALSLVITFFRSGIRISRYKTDLEEIRFRKLIKLPDIFTFLNIMMGLAAIFFVLNTRFILASIVLLFAVIFDYLDGKVAKMTHKSRAFGKNLDSLADTISFGVAPAFFGFAVSQSVIGLITFTLFLFAGILRLARYNIMEFAGTGEYAGMPITLNGAIIPLIYFFGVPYVAYPYIFLFLAIAMVSPLKVKRMF